MAERDDIKINFKTGSKPTEAHFADLIDRAALVNELTEKADKPSAATAITTEVITSYRTMVDINGITFKVAVLE